MDFELSDDQLALAGAARELLDDLASSSSVRSVVDRGGGYDIELWRAMAEQGWMAVEVPEKEGGLGLGLVEVAVLCEQTGRHVAPAPYLSSVLALGAMEGRGVASPDGGPAGLSREHLDALEEWSGRLASGEAVGCVSCEDGAAGAVRAEQGGGGWLLSGRPKPVLYAPVADYAVLSATEEAGGQGLYALSLSEVKPAAENAMDRTRCLGWLEMSGAPAIRLGGKDAVRALLDRGAAATSAEMLGSASRVLEMSVEYAKDRVQFGRPIGSFQAVKHRCADMLVDVEGMWSTAYYAAWTVGAAHPDASIAASTAKSWCSEASKRVMASGLQIHGGIGFTWEHDLHLYIKRAQLDQVTFGDAVLHRDRLARMLRSRVEAGESVF